MSHFTRNGDDSTRGVGDSGYEPFALYDVYTKFEWYTIFILCITDLLHIWILNEHYQN